MQAPFILHGNAGHTLDRLLLVESRFKEMSHPAYSPDLEPNDCHLSPNLINASMGTEYHHR